MHVARLYLWNKLLQILWISSRKLLKYRYRFMVLSNSKLRGIILYNLSFELSH